MNPAQGELCDDKKDNNWNGSTDETPWTCLPGSTRACYDGANGTTGVAGCKMGLQKCDSKGAWGNCDGEVVPSTEVCDGIDNTATARSTRAAQRLRHLRRGAGRDLRRRLRQQLRRHHRQNRGTGHRPPAHGRPLQLLAADEPPC